MRGCRAILAWAVIVVGPAVTSLGQTPYKRPPEEIATILDTPPPPTVVVSPARDAMLLVHGRSHPSIEELAEPLLRLAGARISPRLGAAQRLGSASGLSIQPLDGSPGRGIDVPPGSRIHRPTWSHDGKRVAFARDAEDGVELWVADAATGKAKAIAGARINDVLGGTVDWLRDNRHLLVSLAPRDRGQPPPAPRAPIGPNVRETAGRRSLMPTFPDLLSNPHDEALFEYHATSQLARIDAETGEVERIGAPGLITEAQASPDEKYLLVETLRRPFSYRVPYPYFARKTEVRDAAGRPVATVADLPISDEIPRQGVPTGPRHVRWQPLHHARLVWAEALDGGDPRAKATHRDRIMALDPPFAGSARELRKVTHRLRGLAWLAEKDHTLVTEYDRDRRWRTTSLVDLARPEAAPRVLFDLSVNDAYGDPGRPLLVTRPDGVTTILQDGDSIYLVGQGAAPRGARPFLDRFDLKSGARDRLFHCAEHAYEIPLGFVGDSRTRILIDHESRSEPRNEFAVDLASGQRTRLTDNRDPAPHLSAARKELITYRRGDGVPLSGTLYLPADYRPGTRLPLMIWAYPLEYSDPGTAGQVRTSPDMFPRVRGASQLFFVLRGYALLDNATMPVVGNPETMNNTFVEQIAASARAAIETLDQKGVIDPRRVGVGGHSYGAFMTANLLAHTDLFAAGIARSGAYNRSLTPFGFQSERRSYWEATDVYTRVSPFAHAHKINEPILLIHGEADNNTGTFPIQSTRLFDAIQGNGGTARLVMLPNESHGYSARESVMHVAAEMLEWADRYVKNRPESAASGH